MTDEELIALAGKVVERCAAVVEQRSADLGARAVDAARTAAAIRSLLNPPAHQPATPASTETP